MARAISTLLILSLAASAARAQPGLPAPLREVRFDQRLQTQVPLDLTFRDEEGRPVRLGDLFQGKPAIVDLAQFRCPMLCDQVLNGLVRAMLDLPLEAGKDFEVLTISFDSRETSAMARAKKETYLQRYGRPGAGRAWHFLTADEDSVKRLTEAVGFRFTYDAARDQFAHAAGIVLLTPGGKVSRYFYDVRYSPRDLRLGLVEASEGRIGSAADQVLLFCFHYDPVEGKYGVAVMRLVRLAGLLTVIGLAAFMAVLWRRERSAVLRTAAKPAKT